MGRQGFWGTGARNLVKVRQPLDLIHHIWGYRFFVVPNYGIFDAACPKRGNRIVLMVFSNPRNAFAYAT